MRQKTGLKDSLEGWGAAAAPIQFDLRARPQTMYEPKRGDVRFHRQVQKNGKRKRQGHKDSW